MLIVTFSEWYDCCYLVTKLSDKITDDLIFFILFLKKIFKSFLDQLLSLIPPVQLSSVSQLCLTLWDPMNCSMPGLPVHHQLPESAQTHVCWVSGAIQPSHPPLSPSPLAFNLSEHQGLFKWVSSLHQVAKALEFQLQHQSFRWIFRVDFLWNDLLAV